MSSNPCNLHGLWVWVPLNSRLWLCMAVWLQARVRECGIGLQPRLYAGSVRDDNATSAVVCGLLSFISSMFCLPFSRFCCCWCYRGDIGFGDRLNWAGISFSALSVIWNFLCVFLSCIFVLIFFFLHPTIWWRVNPNRLKCTQLER